MGDKNLGAEESEVISVRYPKEIIQAITKAAKKKALNESDYIRDAIRRVLREDGFL